MGEAAWPVAVAVATGLLTCLTTRVLIPILAHREIVDRPNERSSHRVATPRGGGIAVIGSVLLAWIVLARTDSVPSAVFGIALGAVLLAAVSWLDDLRGLSPVVRLLAQAAAVAVGTLCSPRAAGPLSISPRSASSGSGGSICSTSWTGSTGWPAARLRQSAPVYCCSRVWEPVPIPRCATLAAAVTGAAIGFLVWNWSPARVFLGDVGSVPLGYLLGFMLLELAVRGHWRIALILPLYFLADATITLTRRMLRGERVWQAHREHFYQQAVRSGLGHAAVVERVIAANLVLIGCGWASENGWGTIPLAVSAATVAILLAALARGS